jgi:glycosyltransferase XagB
MIKKHAVIALPTYNERDNIERILRAIQEQRSKIQNATLSVLVIDDNSPDGTGDVVREFIKANDNVHIITGQKQGLGKAYIRGFQYALEQMGADIVMEMDADFSHDPNKIPELIAEVIKGNDFVIGSRYIPGGSIPADWPFWRKMNSRVSNMLARYIGGMVHVNDCTGGFRAISKNILDKVDLNRLNVAGYAFQINLLHRCVRAGATVSEVPITFIDRAIGVSKIRLDDIFEFIFAVFKLRFSSIKTRYYLASIFAVSFFVSYVIFTAFAHFTKSEMLVAGIVFFVLFLSVVMSIQGVLTLVWMYYAWQDSDRADLHRSPEEYTTPHYSFTALVPARHEESVIADTIKAVASIDYPEELKETLVVCRFDDQGTIAAANKAIAAIGKDNVRMVIMDGFPINKPHSLNEGIKEATKEVIAVFDAEDEPHADIYNIINTVMVRDNADVVQSGVQLMNYRSRWFSTFNVLEYFFWFKSALHFFANAGLIPLGGNTVFFKRVWLDKVNGWDEHCLTEDADIGIRMSLRGAKIKVVYDEKHVTQEETPMTLSGFIYQRTRWNQGFMQIFLKGDWKKLPTVTQRLLALYILIVPELQTLLFIYAPLTVVMMIFIKIPVIMALVTFIPFYFLVLQLVTYNIGLYQFTRDYKLSYSPFLLLKTIIVFYPFQLVLGLSALRAVIRMVRKNMNWEKTAHVNAHRESALEPVVVPGYVVERG